MRKIAAIAMLGLGMMLPGPADAQQKTLTIWWGKGFYPSEDIALRKVIDAYTAKTGVAVNLSLFSIEDGNTKAISAVDAGSPPDVGFGSAYDLSARGSWAFNGKLDDVTDIVEPLKADLLPIAVQSAFLQNGKANKKSFYAVPLAGSGLHIFYWRDMLKEAGFEPSDIPTQWEPFWNFWCDKVQAGLRAKGKRVYGMGQPTSVGAGDTYVAFLTYLSAYGVRVIDENGKLTLDDPKVRAGIISAMKDYVSIHQKGCTPPSSINWLDVDNNNNLHNKTTAMTPNSSLSIPGKYLDEKNEEAYLRNLVTANLPLGPNGKPVPLAISLKAAVIFADAKNKPEAHEFLKFFMLPENYGPYINEALGRWIPVRKSLIETDFWLKGNDPHRKVAAEAMIGPLEPFPNVFDYRFTSVNAENVWGKAMIRIVQDKISPEQAVDEMIKRIKDIVN